MKKKLRKALSGVESTTKALILADKSTEDLSTALDVAEGNLKSTDLVRSDNRDKLIPIIKELLKDNKYIGQFSQGQLSERKSASISKGIAEAYHKAKADGSNPELVKVVESILSKGQPSEENSPEIKTIEVFYYTEEEANTLGV